MNKEIQELYEKNFTYQFKAVVYNNIKTAFKALGQFKEQNLDFFDFAKKETVMGYLRTYAIERQFSKFAFTPTAPYSIGLSCVNNYKYKALTINTDDIVLNIGKTVRPGMLLPRAKYKEQLAACNEGLNRQIVLDFNDKNDIILKETQRYALITYGYIHGMLTHLNILIPDSKYKNSLHSENLLKDISIYDNYVPQ